MQNRFSLSEYYELEHFDITEFEVDSSTNEPNLARQLQKLKSFKAIIIAKPKTAFNNLDKLLIDQYIMAGGNLLWLLDGVRANMDSLRVSDGYFMAKKNQLNLDDMLFIYGTRINADLIQDKRATFGTNKTKHHLTHLTRPLTHERDRLGITAWSFERCNSHYIAQFETRNEAFESC